MAVETVKGDYPEGSVLQLMPNEVRSSNSRVSDPDTNDWEFFYIDVDKVYGWFTEGFDTRDLKEVKALLDSYYDQTSNRR